LGAFDGGGVGREGIRGGGTCIGGGWVCGALGGDYVGMWSRAGGGWGVGGGWGGGGG